MRINKSLITYIPTSGAGSGTVTSVALSATMPTGLTVSISGSPVTSSGTLGLTVSFASGYSIPTTIKQSNWDDAYTWVTNFPVGTEGQLLKYDAFGDLVAFTSNFVTNPMTTLGDMIYGNAVGLPLRLAGNPTSTLKYLTSEGDGTTPFAPYWSTISASSIGAVPTTRTLTINGTSYDLSANRSWDTITSLTGEATASGTGAVSVTLTNSAVIGKVLTGLNVTGGSVVATDTILDGFGKLQNQVNGLIGGVMYQGTWDASTNTPALTSSVGTKGYYYVVSVAGNTNLNGILDWNLGDWAIFNGSVWEKVDNTDSVISVNGFTGAVSLTTANISEVTNLYYTDTRARLAISETITGIDYNSSTGVFSTTSGYAIPTTAKQTEWDSAYTNRITNLTTTGNSGAATLIANTLNIPEYTLAGLGGLANPFTAALGQLIYSNSAGAALSLAPNTTTTKKYLSMTGDGVNGDAPIWDTITASSIGALSSVAIAVPTGFSVSGSPLTSNGTITISFASGYALPTTAKQTEWDSAYTNRITNLTTTGNSGASTLIANTLNVPEYTLAGLGGMSNPMTGANGVGDIIYGNAIGAPLRRAPNVTTTKMFLSSTGDGTSGNAPVWEAITTTTLGAVPTSRTLTINDVAYDLSANRSWSVGDYGTW